MEIPINPQKFENLPSHRYASLLLVPRQTFKQSFFSFSVRENPVFMNPILLFCQADYVLGDNPMKMSFLVGYGDKYPQFVHHRGASIPADAKPKCEDGFKWLSSSKPNPNVAVGALVGGPFLNETFIDDRNNSMQTEPSTYNSALIVGLLSGLVTTSSVASSFT